MVMNEHVMNDEAEPKPENHSCIHPGLGMLDCLGPGRILL
jgi:hypothetical protein